MMGFKDYDELFEIAERIEIDFPELIIIPKHEKSIAGWTYMVVEVRCYPSPGSVLDKFYDRVRLLDWKDYTDFHTGLIMGRDIQKRRNEENGN